MKIGQIKQPDDVVFSLNKPTGSLCQPDNQCLSMSLLDFELMTGFICDPDANGIPTNPECSIWSPEPCVTGFMAMGSSQCPDEWVYKCVISTYYTSSGLKDCLAIKGSSRFIAGVCNDDQDAPSEQQCYASRPECLACHGYNQCDCGIESTSRCVITWNIYWARDNNDWIFDGPTHRCVQEEEASAMTKNVWYAPDALNVPCGLRYNKQMGFCIPGFDNACYDTWPPLPSQPADCAMFACIEEEGSPTGSGLCQEDSNGIFFGRAKCESECGQRFACNEIYDSTSHQTSFSCAPDIGGYYTSFAECEQDMNLANQGLLSGGCLANNLKFDCIINSSDQLECVPGGTTSPYSTWSECEANKATGCGFSYKCNTNKSACIPTASSGDQTFNTKTICENALEAGNCEITKYACLSNECKKSQFGPFESEDECKKNCCNSSSPYPESLGGCNVDGFFTDVCYVNVTKSRCDSINNGVFTCGLNDFGCVFYGQVSGNCPDNCPNGVKVVRETGTFGGTTSVTCECA